MNAREHYLRQQAGEDPDEAGYSEVDRPSGYASMLDDTKPAEPMTFEGLDLRESPAPAPAVAPPPGADASSPTYGPTEASLPPPKDEEQMPDTPPPPDGDAEFSKYAPTQPDAPKPPERREDIELLRQIAANAGRDDGFAAQLAAAQGRDRQQHNWDMVSQGLAEATARHALPSSAPGPSEAEGLMQQRAVAQGAAQQKTAAQLALARALAPKEPKAVSPIEEAWKMSQIERNRALSDVEKEANARKQREDDAKKETEGKKLEESAKSLKSAVEAARMLPSVKALKIPDDVWAGMTDRKDVDKIVEEAEKKGNRGGGAGGAPVHIKAGDINSVPEKDRALVAGLLDHSIGIEDIPQRGGDKVRLLSIAKQIDPNFDTVGHAAYKHTAVEQSTDKTMRSLDVLNNHLALAESNIPHNANPQIYNKIANAYKTGSGDSSMTAYTTASHLAADELGKVLNIGSEGGREKLEEIFSNVQSEAQLREAFKTVRHLAEGARQSFDVQANRYAPPSAQRVGGGGQMSPGGKPYASKKFSPSTKKTYFLNDAGKVVESVDGQL